MYKSRPPFSNMLANLKVYYGNRSYINLKTILLFNFFDKASRLRDVSSQSTPKLFTFLTFSKHKVEF